MSHPAVVVLLTILALLALKVLIMLVLGCNFGRLGLALRAYFRTLRDAEFAEKVQPLLTPPPPEPEKPPKPSGAPLRMLTVLQRESRLIDFLLEDIQGAEDVQIGAAVRDLQPKAQAALKKHLVLEPVLRQPEGDTVEVPPGFDPSAIQVIGNVTGQPPFRGVLKHAGWRVAELHLSPPPEGQDEFILAPAEVELP